MSLDHLDVRALREMAKRLHEDIAQEHEAFAQGGWVNQQDVGASGMQAVRIQAKIAGLRAALKHAEETNKLLTGKVEAQPKEMRRQ